MNTPWLSENYKNMDSLRTFHLNVEGKIFRVLINADVGSWAVLTEDEYTDYQNGTLDELKYENLFLRKLAITEDGREADLAFPEPEEYPSSVVVNITTTCNLSCRYCFASCGPTNGEKMSEEVIQEMVRQVRAMPMKKIRFEFQGGEPLLNVEGMRRCIEYAEELKGSTDKTIEYSIETNGTHITDEAIELIKQYDISVGVSLDGPRKLTNQARIYTDGRGAFDEIWDGVQQLREHNIPIGCVCSIGKHNVNHPEEIVEFFAENGMSFKPRPVNILGREITSKMVSKPGEWAECFKRMYYHSKKLGATNLSIYIFEENVLTPLRDYMCLRFPCGIGREVISVNPNGNVFPCDGFKSEEEFKMGNLLEEKITDMLNKPSVVRLKNRTWVDIPKCKKCLFHAMCGSCVYSCYGKYNDIYREDPQCRDRRRIFLFIMKEWIKENVL